MSETKSEAKMGPIAKIFRYDSENLISQCVRNFPMHFFFENKIK